MLVDGLCPITERSTEMRVRQTSSLRSAAEKPPSPAWTYRHSASQISYCLPSGTPIVDDVSSSINSSLSWDDAPVMTSYPRLSRHGKK